MKKPYQIEPRNRFFDVAASIVRQEIRPQNKVTFFSEVDLSEVEKVRKSCVENGLTKPSYTAFVTKAVALALRDHSYANRRVIAGAIPIWGRPRIQRFMNVDVTVAIERDIPGAPMAAFVDVLRDVDQMTLSEVHSRLRTLAESNVESNQQWRDFSNMVTRWPLFLTALALRLPLYVPSLWVKYRGGAVMVSAPGKYGVDTVSANWWSPIGISFGVVALRPVVVNDEVVARPTFNLTCNFDVRIMAGAQAAHFCRRLLDILHHASAELSPLPAHPAADGTSQ